ncbi:ferric uptake regulator, Fur family [Rhodomicrobium vannielii ATCC 17100]|uniref:Ferric uptake regulator, Fur family n=1 Tax=Rhodomicrobium vannielii (strain ATCC 17100 / DSM 162 / LMG 4299 / NCIMB 10020 / ATH 3.1.1) TaxID=648757 RepID=E3I0E1_RHOVT|nr:Fur family transcriptional regulator [Rhodomicrobium vannielii]ADP72259.1 ferric uptake regulator, Fur family [Rhodomicrobium vannielii ATCC 17100]
MSTSFTAFPPKDHDHCACLNTALGRAKARCNEQGIKWTALREQVFLEVATSHKPVSAYDLIDVLAKNGKRVAPVSIYRILDVLQSAGLVHRLESRNAFFACMADHGSAAHTITLVCEDCDRVIEAAAPEALQAIAAAAKAANFMMRHTVVEVSGLCADCAAREAPSC